MTAIAMPTDLQLNFTFETEAELQKFNVASRKLEEDDEFLARFNAAETVEEYFLAGKKYINCTYEEFKNKYDALVGQVCESAKEFLLERELIDAELDLVTGGGLLSFLPDWAKKTITAVVTVACTVAGGAVGAVIGSGFPGGGTVVGAVTVGAMGAFAGLAITKKLGLWK